MTRLQLVQNTLARVVSKKNSFLRIMCVLSDLHWLPVPRKINFKMVNITFKVLKFRKPSFVHVSRCPYFTVCTPTRSVDHRITMIFFFLVKRCSDFLHIKLQWQSQNYSHTLFHIFGINCHVIHFLFSIPPCFREETQAPPILRVFLVFPHYPLTSCSVMPAHPQMQLRSNTPQRYS